MSSSRSSRTTKPSHGAMAYAPYIDERGRRYEPVDESRSYDPGAETSDSEDEDDPSVPSSPKRRRMEPSVSLHRRKGQSVEVRIPSTTVQPPQAQAPSSLTDEMLPARAVQPKPKPKPRSIKDFFTPTKDPLNRASVTATQKGRAALDIVPDQGLSRQGNPAVAKEEEEESDARNKRATKVAKARKTKAELEAVYTYDYDLDAARSER
ncbi:hypothetical protein BKA58DRAFT_446850 [Alternaria rosae]|uniref:uncharacterized protein n=1 Tax=Alternaria rosae TaxID=1187941 RepID=UPI001E8E9BC7|nr:uncharacterized protein BKA58DRAFT_446850 [Alternaria rosae]KAH6882275.1 hypothetical protein BKA58DRAFT_446850 [Alternaria rosae]